MSPSSAVANLELLVVSNDYPTLKLFISAWRDTGSKLESTPSISCATDFVEHRKLDGIVVDMGVKGAVEFISQLKVARGEASPIILACAGTSQEEKAALTAGANFIVQKPISTGRVFDLLTLSGRVQAPQRRQFVRHRLVEPVTILSGGVQYRALISDLSESGMSIRSVPVLSPDSSLEFCFALRSAAVVGGKGKTVWTNTDGYSGIKFDFVSCSNTVSFPKLLDQHAVLLSC